MVYSQILTSQFQLLVFYEDSGAPEKGFVASNLSILPSVPARDLRVTSLKSSCKRHRLVAGLLRRRKSQFCACLVGTEAARVHSLVDAGSNGSWLECTNSLQAPCQTQ